MNRPQWCPPLTGSLLKYAVRRTWLINNDPTSPEIELLKSRMGHFAWYHQCATHGTRWVDSCWSCGMAQEENHWIAYDIAMAMGHLIDEPAGDVPMEAVSWMAAPGRRCRNE